MKSPFKFLDPYELKDYKAFFGRKNETKELYNLVTKNRLTFVYGPSGTGKTSLVQCGLAHRFSGTDWLPLFVRRGEDINASLREEIGKALGQKSYAGEIEAGIQTLYRRFYRPVYLIFDQFEELFILSDSDSSKERLPFYETIADILDAELPCRLLFIMREDYFGHLNEFEQVVPELYHRKIRVEPMNRENLLEVIVGSCEVHHIGFGESRKDPVRILEKMQTDKAGTHMPHVQVYLHMLWQEAQKQQGNSSQQRTIFNQPVIEEVGEIKDVLGRFLSEQKVEIQKKLVAAQLNPPEEVVATVLDVFVSDDGTKIPIPYTQIDEKHNQLTGKFANRLAKLDTPLVAACLNELEYARILRRSEEDYEIAHDTLAAIVDQQRSAEQRQIREIERRIELGYREHEESKKSEQLYFFNAGQLARIEPFLEKAAIQQEWVQFLNESKAEITRKEQGAFREQQAAIAAEKAEADKKRKRAFRTALTAAVLVLAAMAASIFAFNQNRKANEAIAKAEKAQELAVSKTNQAAKSDLIALINIEQAGISDSLALIKTVAAEKAQKLATVKTKEAAAASQLALRRKREAEIAASQAVAALMSQAEKDILDLKYEEALSKLNSAAQLGLQSQKIADAILEIAFFYGESGNWERAKGILDTVSVLINQSITMQMPFRFTLRDIDSILYTRLMERYYPIMISVEGSVFDMGCDTTLNQYCETDELLHSQEVSSFKIAKYETTWWQYFLFCQASGHHYESPGWGTAGNNPAVNISWFDAVLYTNWISNHLGKKAVYTLTNKREGSWGDYYDVKPDSLVKGYRLPTEAEWEYAAKSGVYKSSFIYVGSNNPDSVAWYSINSGSRTNPVGMKKANFLGLHDMSGNVWEWCWDWKKNYLNNPPKDYKGPVIGSYRVLRGGSWNSSAVPCRVSDRSYGSPGYRDFNPGFRIAHSQ